MNDDAYFALFYLAFIGFCFLFGGFYFICRWRMFVKAGFPGKHSFFPFKSYRILAKEIAGLDEDIYRKLFIPFVNFTVFIPLYRGVAKAFGKSDRYAKIMAFFPCLLYPALAFGNCRFIGPGGRSKA